jgi:hypothetical protein
VLTPVPVDVLGYRIVVLGDVNSGYRIAVLVDELGIGRAHPFRRPANSVKTVRGLPVELLVLAVLLRSKAKLHSFWIESASHSSVLPNCPYFCRSASTFRSSSRIDSSNRLRKVTGVAHLLVRCSH